MRRITNRKRGRPPKDGEAMLERFNIRVPKGMADVIHELHRERRDGADTSQVIREVLLRGLEAMGRRI